jgi:hypothetical protein
MIVEFSGFVQTTRQTIVLQERPKNLTQTVTILTVFEMCLLQFSFCKPSIENLHVAFISLYKQILALHHDH